MNCNSSNTNRVYLGCTCARDRRREVLERQVLTGMRAGALGIAEVLALHTLHRVQAARAPSRPR